MKRFLRDLTRTLPTPRLSSSYSNRVTVSYYGCSFFYNGILTSIYNEGCLQLYKIQKCKDDCMGQDILISSIKSGVGSVLSRIWFILDNVGGSPFSAYSATMLSCELNSLTSELWVLPRVRSKYRWELNGSITGSLLGFVI